MSGTKPIYLLADSQLLFSAEHGLAAHGVVSQLPSGTAAGAAYIGVSNGDDPEFYGLFVEAMGMLGIDRCRMIPSAFAAEDAAFLDAAELILLAGGDVEAGWRVLERSGMKEIILARHAAGAVLVGVSAGAVQLGRYMTIEREGGGLELLAGFDLVPFVIDVHRPAGEWQQLENVVRLLEGATRGLGISAGGAVVQHPDGSIEALRHPALEFVVNAGRMVRGVLLPLHCESLGRSR